MIEQWLCIISEKGKLDDGFERDHFGIFCQGWGSDSSKRQRGGSAFGVCF